MINYNRVSKSNVSVMKIFSDSNFFFVSFALKLFFVLKRCLVDFFLCVVAVFILREKPVSSVASFSYFLIVLFLQFFLRGINTIHANKTHTCVHLARIKPKLKAVKTQNFSVKTFQRREKNVSHAVPFLQQRRRQI
jgi:hypothetical protein